MSFISICVWFFALFLHVNLGLSQKIVGQIRGVFSFGRGYLVPRETFPPPNFKVVPVPLGKWFAQYVCKYVCLRILHLGMDQCKYE